jgi:Ca2+/Na+ antiporter
MVELLLTDFVIDLLVIAVSFVALNWASTLAINNAIKVATVTQLGKTSVGFSMIAFSTSLPELTVAFIGAFSGGAALSVGNVLGSNIVNISVIIGLAAILLYVKAHRKRNVINGSNGINVIPAFAKSELSSIHFGLFISSIIPMVLIYINTATWIVGLVLISIFIAYMYQLLKVRLPLRMAKLHKKRKAN